jgi:hypothetical protein
MLRAPPGEAGGRNDLALGAVKEKTYIMRKKAGKFYRQAALWAFLATAFAGCVKNGATITTNAVTYLSVIHGAPYAGLANVYLNDTLVTSQSGITPGTYSHKYGTIRPGSYDVKFEETGADSILAEIPTSAFDTLAFYTLLLYNNAGGGPSYAAKILDDFSQVANNGSTYVRFWNLCPDVPSVDLYFDSLQVQSGRGTADNITNTLYNQFQQAAPGTYDLTVRIAQTDTVVVTSLNVKLLGGNAYTIFATENRGTTPVTFELNVLQAAY